MIHECKITVLETKVFPEYQKKCNTPVFLNAAFKTAAVSL